MKTTATTMLTIFALIGTLWSTGSFAQDKTNPNQKMDHSQMMGKMDHAQMKEMMKGCMDTHKDGKMCDQDTMKKCQMSMKMEDCQKMMKESKKEKHQSAFLKALKFLSA